MGENDDASGFIGGQAQDERPTPTGDERRVPAPRVDPGLFLQRDTKSDSGLLLEPLGDGRLRHSDPRFTAIIAADGTVDFRDAVIKPETKMLGADLLKGKFNAPKPIARNNFEERALYPHGLPTTTIFLGFGGGFGGLLGSLHRKTSGLGANQGHANMAAKAQFLAETEGLRMRMRYAWIRHRLAEQQGVVVEQVLSLWRDVSLPLIERRRRIFVLWDECAEPVDARSPAEEIQAEAARAARSRIEALIRMLAPQGSPQQYTATELADLNARRQSRAQFDPYATSEP